MPTRLARCRRNQADHCLWPSGVLSTCSRSDCPSSATSSLRLLVSMPAQIMLCLRIFVALPCDANPWFLQPSGPDEDADRDLATMTALTALVGNDPTIGGPAWVATQAGPFLAGLPPQTDSRSFNGWPKARRGRAPH